MSHAPSRRRPAPRCELLAAVAVAVSLGAGCSRGGGSVDRLTGPVAARPAPAPFDWEHPERSLRMGTDEAVARLGSLDWWGSAAWTARRGDRRQGAGERHRVRQHVDGSFVAQSDVDPGTEPGAETGMRVVFAQGTTWARSRYAPSGAWRERPSDHGRDARRFRDQAFGLAGEVAELLGPALRLSPRGPGEVLGRPARRYALELDRDRFAPGPSRLSRSPARAEGPAAEDTSLRLAFLDGREPLEVSGELLADAATGAPLEVRIRAVLGVKDDPQARVEVQVEGKVTALGSAVAAVHPPEPALPDERKPRGVARALERAGYGRTAAAEAAREPADDDESPEDSR